MATNQEAWLQVGTALVEAVRGRSIPTDLDAAEAHSFLTQQGEIIQVAGDGIAAAAAAVREVLGRLAPPDDGLALDILLLVTRMARVYQGPDCDHQVSRERQDDRN